VKYFPGAKNMATALGFYTFFYFYEITDDLGFEFKKSIG
jgi:hypothetical protein